MARRIGMLVVLTVCLLALAGCGCEHVWQEASCAAAATCEKCGQMQGEKLEHVWQEATCEKAKSCTLCGLTEGEANGHGWHLEECTGYCTVCGADDPTAPGHQWQEETCTEAKVCTVCGLTEGEATGHQMSEADCSEPSRCVRCGYVDWVYARPLGHTLAEGQYHDNGLIRKTGTCSVCGKAIEYFFHRDKIYAWTEFEIAADGSYTNPVTYVRSATKLFQQRGEYVRIQWFENGKLVSPSALSFDRDLTCHAFYVDGKVYYHTTNQYNNAQHTRKVLLETASSHMSYASYKNERYGNNKYDNFALLYLLDESGNEVGLVRTAYDIERTPYIVVVDNRTGEAWLEKGKWK